MSMIEARLKDLGLELPAATVIPAAVHLPFSLVNQRDDRLLISGHPKSNADGSIGGPFGQLGADMTTEEGYQASRDIALAVLANVKAEIGDLDRIAGWVRVFGMVNSAPGYSEQHLVINGFSDVVLDVFGPDVGRHARSAIGTAGLPMNFAIEVEAEVVLRD
ncbi:enamine deaminase RidA (YjgF/YER057c/UK114 family) [Shimia isoporae]|uniref:Enamine deaminase RidA (YjgF/YER057c/UK114 family) n=1 Tax=Shimia isoporae TaxID=647720 RepID=A0A4R1N7R3_9RHOB|nr:RidA family protein [Shimia isoporae]TCL01124.1 enamine deaminase RidA (YjgF/YER057c/UK114 family) [Shimia isoporae]